MKKWKKTGWVVSLILLIGLSACKEDEEAPRRNLLLGTWNLAEQAIEQVTVSSGDDMLTFSEEEFIQFLAIAGEDIEVDDLRIFSEDAVFTFNEDQSYLIQDADGIGNIGDEWNLNETEDQLTLQIADESLPFDIVSLSSNQMRADFVFNQIEDGTQFQIDFIFTFTK